MVAKLTLNTVFYTSHLLLPRFIPYKFEVKQFLDGDTELLESDVSVSQTS